VKLEEHSGKANGDVVGLKELLELIEKLGAAWVQFPTSTDTMNRGLPMWI
jgi:hypothetical protein